VAATESHVPGAIDERQLRIAIRQANLPTLLMVIFQLTGDERWLEPPYQPTRTRGLDEHRNGGFPEPVQRQVREAAIDAVLAWSRGVPVAITAPTGDLLVRLMSVCMGEPVAAEYAPMMAAEMGFASAPGQQSSPPRPKSDVDFSVIIIGAGISGLVAAVKLRQAGIACTVLEKNAEAGGTWFDNRYPGCGVDTPSYLYSYSFFPQDWTVHFGKRDEILAYLQRVAADLGINTMVRYGETVTAADWDEASQRWVVQSSGPEGQPNRFVANAVITAVGQLNIPSIPNVAGVDTFEGPIFHSARWPADLDLSGKDVAVVGSAATAMQIVPAIAPEVAQLTIFQRSPQWIAPNSDYFKPISQDVHWLMNNLPYYRQWYRFRLAWTFNDKVHPSLTRDPAWPHDHSINATNDGHRRYFTHYLKTKLAGREDLIAKSLPRYPPFAKRMLLDNGWFAALRRANVELVVEPITGITSSGVQTADGTDYHADAIVFATGFQARRPLYPIEIRGRSQRSIRAEWGDDDPRAYLGMSTPGFPNLFFMYGPNLNLGHGGSYIFLAECQVHYLVDLFEKMVAGRVASVECRPDVHNDYNRRIDQAHETMIWTHPGTDTWYRNARGRVVTNFPWRVLDFWNLTRSADLNDFVVIPTAVAADNDLV
jgi:4-hydroxyacetophenone monooxygenase